MDKTIGTGPVDCACVIHSNGYDWQYVDKLYRAVNKHIAQGVRFHVYTEPSRDVPDYMIRHDLDLWPGVAGPKRSWWYKLQLFNTRHHTGNMLYLDLDTVIVRDISWITQLDTSYFWAIRDFKHLQRPDLYTINSSVMWFNVSKFGWVWDNFAKQDINFISRRYPGDQDYIHAVIDQRYKRYFADQQIKSWRWQCLDGGYDFPRRKHHTPGTGTLIPPDTSVLVFHGHPKPHEIADPEIVAHWN